MNRCSECGSYDAECAMDKPQPDCGCARCLRARNETLRKMWESSETVITQQQKYIQHADAEAADLREQLRALRGTS